MAKPIGGHEDWLARVSEAVNGLKYGTVLVIVHDGRVVQIERTERFRYENAVESRKAASSQSPPQ